MSIKIRTTEGRNGLITALILPLKEKIAVPLEIPVKALNLHTRMQLSEKQFENLPASILKLTGKFDIEDAVQWVSNCLPEVPPSNSEEKITLGYKQSFLGTLLFVKLQANQIVVTTDNLSVLAIIKESLSADAS